MKGKGGLRRALLQRFLLLSLSPLFLVGTVAYLLASRSLETRIAEYLQEQAYQLSGSVDRILNNTAADVTTWAQLSVFKGALLFGSYEKSNQYLSDFKDAYSVYHAIHLYDQKHYRVASSSSEADTTLTDDEFSRVLSGKLTVSPVRKGSSGFRMIFAAPITNTIDQSVTGAVVAELDWDLVLALVDEAQKHAKDRGHESYRITLIDGAGRVVAD
jgi:methyl-accepting chemotaxis protein